MKLAIRIQHHPKRFLTVEALKSALTTTKEYVDFKVIDNEKNCWSGCRAALESFKSGEDTHVLILQDDILPCTNFIPAVKKIIKLLPDQPITFFSNSDSILEAKNRGVHWAKLKVWFMAQAYVLPVQTVREFLYFSDTHVKSDLQIDDERLAMFFFHKKQYVWATSPSLVDHIGWNNTTVRRENVSPKFYDIKKRVASYFAGYETDASLIDWRKGLDNPIINNDGDWSMFSHNYKA
jgi:GR25 family glycosyltransferase involved in LPS biosynthesis